MLHYKRLHWFPFCPSDWIVRMANHGISIPSQGVLIRLLCIQWLEGDIPMDPKECSRAIGGYAGEGFLEALALFVPCQGKSGRQYYPPLEASREEAILTHKRRQKAGLKGAEKRWSSENTRSVSLQDN